MYKAGIWQRVLALIVSLFFVAEGISMLRQGIAPFAIIWLLITGTFLVRSIQELVSIIRSKKQISDDMEENLESSHHQERLSMEKQRLMKLEDLYHSGLISKAEYEEKRKEIIEEL